MSFPFILNLDKYVDRDQAEPSPTVAESSVASATTTDMESESASASPDAHVSMVDDQFKSGFEDDFSSDYAYGTSPQSQSRLDVDDVVAAMQPDSEAAAVTLGEYTYELFSVMIHSGSALGGHYYAYIRSFDDGCWYDFNDSSVRAVSESQVREAFGGERRSQYSYVSYGGASG